MNELETQEYSYDIAIIGMAGRFPGAKNVDEFWENIRDGVESITFFSDEDALAAGVNPELLKKPDFVKAHGILDDVEMFDASFFDMSPRDAGFLDPQHRIFLECAWEALENAGYDSETYKGRIGVFAGTSFSTYLLRNILPNNLVSFPTADRLEMALTNHKDTMPMRVSFHMNLTGPSISLGTTCSTSLVAVHLACQSLLGFQSDMVMAGASFVRIPPKEGYLFQEGMIYSPDGHIRTFDADSRGIVTGAGAGIVVMKRLEEAIADGDFIHAVIKASAVNNDGSTKIGYTAPSVDGQAEAISEAISLAGIDSDSISYIEAHGTGTELGDPVEIASMTKAFRATASDPGTRKKNFCAVGSSKPNIGHLNHASGMAGLIKTVMALKHRQLPPSINFKKPNPKIDFDSSPFYVNSTLKEWQTGGTPRRAGVNAFGIGGTNAHIVLEETPAQAPPEKSRGCHLLVISAKTAAALEAATSNLIGHFKKYPDINLADAAYTLQMGRRAFNYRRMLVCRDREEAVNSLEIRDPEKVFNAFRKSARPVVFMFSGQGSQYMNMALELYNREPEFREQIDYCSKILKPHIGHDLRHLLYPGIAEAEEAAQQLEQTGIAQPALFVVEYALARLWMQWGVQPAAMIGHSIGEYTAACLAGVFSLEDALLLVAARAKMMQQMPPGKMLAVSLPAQEIEPLLAGGSLSLAVINGPSRCVLAGKEDAVKALQQQLNQKGIVCGLLHTSHAFHSEMMEPVVKPFSEHLGKIVLNPPKIPYLSNLTGTWITDEQAVNPGYWSQHLRNTVRFGDGLKKLLQDPGQILLEVGPGRTLSTLAQQHPDKNPGQPVLTSVRHPLENHSDSAFLLNALGRLWLAGAGTDWSGFYKNEHRRRIPLPTYPFERRYYWIDAPKPAGHSPAPAQMSWEKKPETEQKEEDNSSFFFGPKMTSRTAPGNEKENKIAGAWNEVLGLRQTGIHDNFFELGGNSLTASKLVARLCEIFQTELSVRDFLNAPTIAGTAGLIKTGDSDQDTSGIPGTPPLAPCLIRIQSGSHLKKPLFLVHPIDGMVLFYREMSSCLAPGRPVYGFQARGLEGEAEPFGRIEDMAAHYIRSMRSIQPEGPYFIGGTSFGGIVAFEMAQQLHAQGRAVELLFLIDSPVPGKRLFHLDNDADMLVFIAENILKMEKNFISAADLLNLSPEAQIDCILEKAKTRGQLPGDVESFQLQQIFNVCKSNEKAMRNYVPGIYPGRFLYFRAREPWEKDKPYHPEHFWTDLAGGGIEINTVPGNHVSMNYLPYVRTITERLEILIR